jgi:hypothetical protein
MTMIFSTDRHKLAQIKNFYKIITINDYYPQQTSKILNN